MSKLKLPYHRLMDLVFKAKPISQNIFKLVQDFVVSCHICRQNTSAEKIESKKRQKIIVETNIFFAIWKAKKIESIELHCTMMLEHKPLFCQLQQQTHFYFELRTTLLQSSTQVNMYFAQ